MNEHINKKATGLVKRMLAVAIFGPLVILKMKHEFWTKQFTEVIVPVSLLDERSPAFLFLSPQCRTLGACTCLHLLYTQHDYENRMREGLQAQIVMI